ncbi:MAG: TIGR02206 family membrane protein [Alphaproteobacteria bacterium]
MSPFVLFGPSHLIALVLTIAVAAVLVMLVRRRPAADRPVRTVLGLMLLGVWGWWYALAGSRGWLTIGDALPMNLCDWATIATLVTLFHPNQKSYELAYFWALGGTVQGMLTPDTPYDFPEARFLIFFVYHGGIIAAVLYLTFGLRLRPRLQSLPRVILWSFVYLLAAGATDLLLGTNYGFLRAKPAQTSLFNVMPPWPWYVAELIALGFVSAALYYAPWFLTDRLRVGGEGNLWGAAAPPK